MLVELLVNQLCK